jgi:hypothetical protein
MKNLIPTYDECMNEYYSNPYNLLLETFFTFEEDGDFLEHKWLELDECIYIMSLKDLIDTFVDIAEPSDQEETEFKAIMQEIRAEDEESEKVGVLINNLENFFKKYDKDKIKKII